MAATSDSSLASTKEEAGATAFTKEIEVPEWETAGAKSRQSIAGISSQPSAFTSIKSRFNRTLPPNRRYAGMSRRLCLIVSATTFLLLLALIIGLAVGLSQRKQWDSPVAAAVPSKISRITPKLKPDRPPMVTPVLPSVTTDSPVPSGPSITTEVPTEVPEETIAPEPTEDPEPTETAVEAPAEEEEPTNIDSNSSGTQNLPLPTNTQTFTGQLTYYDASLGACGEISTNADNIAAVSWEVFDAAGSSSATGGNSNNNPLCGRMLRITRTDARDGQQKSADLKVVDRCTGCKPTDIDTTIGVFTQLAAEELGRVDVTWAWLPN